MSSFSPVVSISLSGMRAAQAALGASAHNIANLATPGLRREQVSQSTVVGGGVTAAVGRADAPGHAIEADMVNQLVARNRLVANLAVFSRGDQMLGALLDTRR